MNSSGTFSLMNETIPSSPGPRNRILLPFFQSLLPEALSASTLEPSIKADVHVGYFSSFHKTSQTVFLLALMRMVNDFFSMMNRFVATKMKRILLNERV